MNKCSYERTIKCKRKVWRKPAMKKTYKIDVDCANCANKMEEAAKATTGVKDATVNFMTLKMNVEFEDGADAKAVMQDVLKNCKKVEDDCEIFL
jgi:copper chaperone CopZ